MNPYASYATTAVDVAGTNHIIWENNGQLIHAIYDQNSGTWDQARPVSDARGGENLKLLAGNIYPYVEGGKTNFAPGLVAFWEEGVANSKEIYAVVGRYTADGEIEWSRAVQLTNDGVADQNLDAALLQDGLMDVVYQKSLVMDPRDPAYTLEPAQMAVDAANPNRDDTDLYHTLLSVDLDNNGNPYLNIFDGQTFDLAFTANEPTTAFYTPLGPGVQGISANGSTSNSEPELASSQAPNSPGLPQNSFMAGVTRGFNVVFGSPSKMVDGRIGVPLISSTSNFGLQLSGSVGLAGNRKALKAKLGLQFSNYNKKDRTKGPESGLGFSSSVRTGGNIFGYIYSINLGASGQINYDAETGNLVGTQRAWGVDIGFYKQYKANFGSQEFSLGQFRAGIYFDVGIGAGFTFTDPLSGTTPPFLLVVPEDANIYAGAAGTILAEIGFLMSSVPGANLGVGGGILQGVGDLAAVPILISAIDVTMPPFVPWPGLNEYQNFAYGIEVPLGLKVQGTLGIFQNTLVASATATAGITFEVATPNSTNPNFAFSIPWQVGFQAGLQAGIFTWSWSWSKGGTIYNSAPSSGATLTLPATESTPDNNGLVTVGYNPYTGNANHYQSLTSQSVIQQLVSPNSNNSNGGIQTTSTAQIGYATLSNGGSNYFNGQSGSFQIAIPGSSTNDPALATAFVTLGRITNLTITDQGSGYQDQPLAVQFNSSGGTGAAATVTVDSTGRITQVQVTNGGSGYLGGKSGNFVVTPSGSNTNPALLSVAVTNGAVAKVQILNPGLGYTQNSVFIDFSQNGGGGIGGTALAQPINTQLVNVVNDGPPQISSITYNVNNTTQTATTLAWVADGVDNVTPLTNATKNNTLVTRIQTAVLSGTDWSAPESVAGVGSTGFNFDPAIGYYLDASGNPGRFLVWAHADTPFLNPSSPSSEIVAELTYTDIYYSIAASGEAWSTPQLLAQNLGSDTKVTIGEGPTPGELIVSWVNTPWPNPQTGETSQSVYAAVFNGQTQAWTTSPTAIPNVGNSTGKAIASLTIGEFQGNPAVFWSDTTTPGYAYTVLQNNPDFYFRLSEPVDSLVAFNWASGGTSGNGTYVGTINFGQSGALLAPNSQGDANPSVGFNGQGYVLAPGQASKSTLGDFSVEFWVNADSLSPGQSLVDQGVYNPNAVLPTATLPLTIIKAPTQRNGVWGYLYGVAIAANPAINITNGGSGLSPFNLDLANLLPGTSLTLSDGTPVTLNGLPLLNLNVNNGELTGITGQSVTQIIGSKFVANPQAQGQQTTTFTQTETLTFQQTPGWYVRTGENNTIVFNAGGGEAVSSALDANTWYYVAATYNSSTQTASLYINGELALGGQQIGSRFSASGLPLILGYNFTGKLDEVAYYNSLITTNTNSATLDSNGQVSSFDFSSNGQITAHYQNRFNDPNAAEDATFYSIYDPNSGAWGGATQFSAQAADQPTYPLLERNPVVDIVANSTQLIPDGQPDSRVRVQPGPGVVAPGATITGIKIQSADNTDFNDLIWTLGDAAGPGRAIGVVANGQLLNPLNPSADFAYTVMSVNPTLDLYFQGSYSESNLVPGKTVDITFYIETSSGEPQPTNTITATIIPNPTSTIGGVTEEGREQLAIGVILENEVTALDQVNSGVVLDVPANTGKAIAAGNFLNNQVAFAISKPSANSREGVIWVLPAGSTDTLDTNNLQPLSETTPPTGGALIKDSTPSTNSNATQLGNVIAVGDVNGDGIDDLIIGAAEANNKAGQVYVISGATITPDSTIDLANSAAVILSGQPGSQAGFAVAAGDVNGDGFADIVVGAPYASYNGQQVGAAYVILGGHPFFDTPTINLNSNNLLLTGTSGSYIDQYLNNVTWTSQVGFSVAVSRPKPTPPFYDFSPSQSVNGDNFADIVIGAPNYRQAVQFAGDGLNQGATKAQGQAYSQLLATVANTGSGYSYTKNMNTGRGYIIFGGQTLPTNLNDSSFNGSNGVVLDGSPMTVSDTQLGWAVSTGNDVNGDGFDDVLIGAPYGNNGTGLSFVLAGQASGSPFQSEYVLTQAADLVIGGNSAFSFMGKTLSLAGDINGDGLADLVFGAPNTQYSTGQSHVIFGKDRIFSNGTPNYISLQPGATAGVFNLNGGGVGHLAGGSMWSGTDINGDGINDLLLSAPYGSSAYAVFGHEWLADDGNLKLTNLAGNNGLIIDGSDLSNTFAPQELGGLSYSSPSMTNDGDDTLYIAVRGTNGTDYVASSTNGGQTWGGFSSLPPGEETDDYFPSIAFYDGVLYLAYAGGGYNQVFIAFSTNQGQTWESDNFYALGNTSSGTAPTLVVYQDQLMLLTTNETNGDLQYVYSSNPQDPNAWSNTYNVTYNNGSANQTSSSAVGAAVLDDTLYLVYQTGTLQSPGTGVYGLGTATPNGTSPGNLANLIWDYNGTVNIGQGAAQGVGLTADSTQLYLTYTDGQGDFYVNTSSNGQDWRNPIIVPNQDSNLAPAVTTLNDQLYVGYTGTDISIYVTNTALPVLGNVTANPSLLLGDINGDGFADVLMGGENASLITFGKGTEALLDESLGTGDLTLTLASGGFQDVFGLGDVNGDNLQDFGVIDNNNNVYLVLGSNDLGTKTQLTVSPLSSTTPTPLNFGTAAGDLNGDGFADVIVGLRPNFEDPNNYNQLYIAFGNAQGALNFQALNIVSNFSVNAAGDVNGDGIDDLILGNPTLNNRAGAFYVLLGNPNLPAEVSNNNSLTVIPYLGTPNVNAPEASDLNWEADTTENINANFGPNDDIGNTGLSTVVFNGEVVTIWVNNNSQLAFSTSTDGTDWNSGNLFPNAWQTDAVPGLVEFNNQLYAYWYYGENGANSTAIYYSQYQGNGQWGGLGYTNLTNNSLNVSSGLGGGINLVEYNNTLYAIWQGTGGEYGNSLYFSSSLDGSTWAAPQAIPNAAIFQAESVPSLVVFQNTLYAYYTELNNSGETNGIYYITYDSASNAWSNPQLISNLSNNNYPNAVTDYGLSLVNVEDQTLYMAWQGGEYSNNDIFIASSSDGVNWTVPEQIDNIYGWGIPSLYLFNDTVNLVTPAATQNNTSTTSILSASTQQLVFPTALGNTLSPVGDVNGDGYADVVVYAPTYFDPNSGNEGAGYLQFGGNKSPILLTGVNLQGAVISKAGDLNGDGIDDILISNPNYSSSTYGQDAGITYVVFGASNLSDLSSINLGDLQPVSTASGTVTDGKIGLINLTNGGSGYLSNGSGTFNIEVTSSTSTEAGIVQATVANGVITGVEVTNPGAGFTSLTGLDYTFINAGGGSGANISVTSLVSLGGFQIVGLENSLAGQSLSGGGDVNGDGFDDLVVGAPGDELSYVLFGGDFTASVNQYGSIGDDTLKGTATGDILLGQAGDDVLLGEGAIDVLLGATGNDWLQVQDANFRRVDGGSGTDTLALYGYNGQAWDLTTLAPGNRIKNIETIDIRNYGSNLLTLNQATILQLTDTKILTINGDSSDKINLSPGFSSSGTQYANGQTYNVYESGLAQAWINATIPTRNITFTAPIANTPAPVIQTGNLSTTAPPTSANGKGTAANPANNQATKFHVSSPVVAENGRALIFQVTRTGALTQPAAAQYRTINDTAQAGSHYHAQVGYLVFAAGETLKEVSIELIDDQILGPRQRHLKLGLTPFPDPAAATLSQRSLNFENEPGSQLRNLGLSLLGTNTALSQTAGLPFNQLNFNVSTANGPKTTVMLPLAGLANLNSFYRINPTTSQFESFFFDGNTGVEFLDTSGDGQTDTLKLHLEDGGRGDSDGVVNGVVSGFNAPGQVTPGPHEVNPGIFLIPTSYDGQLQFQNLNLAALGNPELGVFAVDDAQGRIGTLLPTDPGYLAAAQARQQVLFENATTASPNAITRDLALAALADPSKLIPTELQANGAFNQTQLTGNRYYGFYWNQDGQTQISINNPNFAATEDQRGYTTLAWGEQQWEMVSTVLVTPGQSGQTVNATLELARAAAYENTIALFRVDSLTGGLDVTNDGQIDLRPGDVGYAEAALQRVQDPLTGRILETISLNFSKINQSVTLAGASMYGLVLISNGTVSDFLTQNPTNAASGSTHSFFNFEAANPDQSAHVRRLGQNLWGFEDMFDGGDRDFNDILLSVAWQQQPI